MIPSARLQATIELLDQTLTSDLPADALAADYFRLRRYIGSKDRKDITERFWSILRHRRRLAWHLDGQTSGRAFVLAHTVMIDRSDPFLLFTNEHYGAPRLTADEAAMARVLANLKLEPAEMPEADRLEAPYWAEVELRESLGDDFAAAMTAMLDRAETHIRINTAKTDRDKLAGMLADEGIATRPAKLSPWGLIVPGRAALTASMAFKNGLFEIQDEGSQLVGLLTDARPGQDVLDLCAGSGGKTMILSSTMEGKGRIAACDINGYRIDQARRRFKRAGIGNVRTQIVKGTNDNWLGRRKKRFDRVLVDAPCSGTGIFRR
ncbi:MAG: RsmB/NOP family class I SAM-dependent RNA methyltransferase, partial [Pseudomonadota bacterium]|nr:RsmB/NOP family class I SAM-dependent RNA methyltransferase [Pseudomonadota bacterium]